MDTIQESLFGLVVMDPKDYLKIQKGCGCCNQLTTEYLVKCTEKSCHKWFCNGCQNDKSNGMQNDSHIITHLKKSGHRRIAVLANLSHGTQGTIVGERFLFHYGCTVCKKDNPFDLGMKTASNGQKEKNIFCHEHGIDLVKIKTWTPLVDCHYSSKTAKCFSEYIVKVPLQADQQSCKQLSLHDIIDLEKSWSSDWSEAVFDDDLEVVRHTRYCFGSTQDFLAHFSTLIKLESALEARDYAAIPILHNIKIVGHDNATRVKWFEFKAKKSQIHRKYLQRRQPVVVNVERDEYIQIHAGFIISYHTDEEDPENVVIRVGFWKHNDQIQPEDFSGPIGIEVAERDVVTRRRWMEALERFSHDGNAVQNPTITNLILGLPDQANFWDLVQAVETNGKPDPLMDIDGLELNASQEKAVRMALRFPLSLIQGPPGTGKTHTTVAIVYHLIHRISTARVLCCALSNDPTDHLALQLAKFGLRVLRITSQRIPSNSLPKNIRKLTLRYKLEEKLGVNYEYDDECTQEKIDLWTDKFIRRSQVICTTCITAADHSLRGLGFPYVVIDEATQATEVDSLVPITKGCEKLVLIGDEKQLGVLSKFRELERSNRGLSMFERLIKLGQAPRIMLDTQYRMHPDICKPPSMVIYDGLLQTDAEVAALRKTDALHFMHPSPQNSGQILMIDTGTEHRIKFHGVAPDAVSLLNEHEAIVVVLCLVNLFHRGVHPEDIGVITFYKGQRKQLRNTINNHVCIPSALRESLMVASVDAFQGREKNYIILSCVRSGSLESTNVGFLADKRRLNVALTPAKQGVIIVGNLQLLRKNETWREILAMYPVLEEDAALSSLGVKHLSNLDCLYCNDPSQRFSVFMKKPVVNLTNSRLSMNVQLTDQLEQEVTNMSRDIVNSFPSSFQEEEKEEDGYVLVRSKKQRYQWPQPWQVSGAAQFPDAVFHADMADMEGIMQFTAEWTNKELYQAFEKYKLTLQDRRDIGYPVLYEINTGSCSVNGLAHHKITSKKVDKSNISGLKRTCARCRKIYTVNHQGHQLDTTKCVHHWGKKNFEIQPTFLPRKRISKFTYSCCNGNMSALGCTVTQKHVSRSYSSMFDFVTTEYTENEEDDDELEWSVLAMDCEMLYTTGGYEVGRITLVNRQLKTVYDRYIHPKCPVVDYNTKFSGLTRKHFLESQFNGVPVRTLDEVQMELIGSIIYKFTILVGHSLEEDLLCLKIVHNLVVDTASVFRPSGNSFLNSPALRILASDILNKVIQDNTLNGHDSAEDARTCMELMLWKIGKSRSS